ncbi:hypothetical protein [Paenibacillus agri]|uniref:Uncharacterized protein n=1 Tax=Paenibacillus agri TaxID=2744309 RepID=A0A850EPK1_9BACL|nr:hypothetical protein [Paenibacillus agri]
MVQDLNSHNGGVWKMAKKSRRFIQEEHSLWHLYCFIK